MRVCGFHHRHVACSEFPSRMLLFCHGRQKDKERTSRLSLFLAKSGSHENVSPHKTTNSTGNK